MKGMINPFLVVLGKLIYQSRGGGRISPLPPIPTVLHMKIKMLLLKWFQRIVERYR